MLQEIIKYINVLSGGNQFIGGVIMTFVSGAILFLLRDVPIRLAGLFRMQMVTSVIVDTTSWNKKAIYAHLLNYIGRNATEFGTRSLSYDASYDWTESPTGFVSVGFGSHLFFFERKPLLAVRRRIEQHGTDANEYIVLYKLGRSHQLFYKLLETITPKRNNDIYIYTLGKDGWERTGEIDRGEGIDSVALDEDIRNKFVREFKDFHEKRAVHKRLGIAHKLSYVLHGLPGSGKTSLIRAIAAEFGMNVCLLDVQSVTDAQLVSAFGRVPKNSIVLAEDFDSATQLHRRTEEKSSAGVVLSDLAMGSLKGMLNALEGIQALDNVVVIFTTNHLEKIDPALIRPGRIDHIRQLPQPGIAAIKQHFIKHYPTIADMHVNWGHLPGCIIHQIKQRSLDNADSAAELINYYVRNPDVAIKEQMGRMEELEEVRRMHQHIAELAAAEPPTGDSPRRALAVTRG